MLLEYLNVYPGDLVKLTRHWDAILIYTNLGTADFDTAPAEHMLSSDVGVVIATAKRNNGFSMHYVVCSSTNGRTKLGWISGGVERV